MGESNFEKIEIKTSNLAVTIACYQALLEIDYIDRRDWQHESADYFKGIQMMAHESLIYLQNDLADYPGFSDRISGILENTEEIVDLKISQRRKSATNAIYDHWFFRFRAQLDFHGRRFIDAAGRDYFNLSLDSNAGHGILCQLSWMIKPDHDKARDSNAIAYDVILRSQLSALKVVQNLRDELPPQHFLRECCLETDLRARRSSPFRDWQPGRLARDGRRYHPKPIDCEDE